MKLNVKKVIRNKYVIATVLFVLLLIFSERNSIIDQFKLQQQLNRTRAEHEYYRKEIEKVRNEEHELFSSTPNLEKFAREKYLMKRDNEDVFVIVREKK
jgi:cell division protein FtsB